MKIKRLGQDLSDAHAVRRTVFVEEQGFSQAGEFDEKDADAIHFAGYIDNRPVATGRIVNEGNGRCSLGRICVLKEVRETGQGRQLMRYLIDAAKKEGFQTIIVRAQVRVSGFYEKMGFVKTGEEFYEEHVAHVKMILEPNRSR